MKEMKKDSADGYRMPGREILCGNGDGVCCCRCCCCYCELYRRRRKTRQLPQ